MARCNETAKAMTIKIAFKTMFSVKNTIAKVMLAQRKDIDATLHRQVNGEPSLVAQEIRS